MIPSQGTDYTKVWQREIESLVGLACSPGGGNGKLHIRACMGTHMVYVTVIMCI